MFDIPILYHKQNAYSNINYVLYTLHKCIIYIHLFIIHGFDRQIECK